MIRTNNNYNITGHQIQQADMKLSSEWNQITTKNNHIRTKVIESNNGRRIAKQIPINNK